MKSTIAILELASPQDLDPNARIVLYGAGDYGIHYLEQLRQERSDVDVVCFLDSFCEPGGVCEGVPIVNIADFDFTEQHVDVVITAAGVAPISHALQERGLQRCYTPVVTMYGAQWFQHRDIFEAPLDYAAQMQGYRFWENIYRWRYRALLREHFGSPEPLSPLSDTIPQELLAAFTMNGASELILDVQDQRHPSNYLLVYTDDEIDDCISRIKQGDSTVYAKLDEYVRQSLQDHPVEGKSMAVFGSTSPWYESMCLAYGAHPTTVEYYRIISRTNRLRTLTVDELKASNETFDHAMSISSFEHDGLGAYGDPLNPNADLEAMQRVRELLNDGGLLFLNVPVAKQDMLIFNGCRVYGEHRLPMLFEGYTLIDSYGYDTKRMDAAPRARFEPLFVLQKS
ncbi:DUF268 domain-containing protein [Desulfovibrio inopinatus]|uniref:DUF268 domain-containing protein n=1 Tax=Desulfovibrio inopinatus TaxID=102109 RepID=UPI00040DA29E|nr:DUF268 domain-containing protein [Desulfovibrio inopinatus]